MGHMCSSILLSKVGIKMWIYVQMGMAALNLLFAPYFAHEAAHDDTLGGLSAIVLSVFFSISNAVLVNIQAALEDPFDGDTADDISLALFEPSWDFWTFDRARHQGDT